MPNTFSHPSFTYRIISWMLFPAAILFSIFVAIKYRSRQYLLERLGIFSSQSMHAAQIWCHCASVGEINTALPLFKQLLAQNLTLLISTNTITGHQTLQNAGLDNTSIIFLPLDYRFFYTKLLSKFTPEACLIFETELWPNLFLTAHRKNIPIAIVNGRIGDKTLNAPHFLHTNYRRALTHVTQVIASSDENAQRFISLGTDANNVTVLDNLKFALPAVAITELAKPLTFPYLLCASTHADEELQIIHQWLQNKPDSLSLVIAIRHPQRTKEVCKQIESVGLEYILHSKRSTVQRLDQIYVIDTLGELAPFMAYADLVFMGGSLIPLGGHNVLEPARMSKCVITGPHYQNFKTIVDELAESNGIIIVKDADDLMQKVNELTNNRSLRIQFGENAQQYVQSKQQILKQYTQIILQFIHGHSR